MVNLLGTRRSSRRSANQLETWTMKYCNTRFHKFFETPSSVSFPIIQDLLPMGFVVPRGMLCALLRYKETSGQTREGLYQSPVYGSSKDLQSPFAPEEPSAPSEERNDEMECPKRSRRSHIWFILIQTTAVPMNSACQSAINGLIVVHRQDPIPTFHAVLNTMKFSW